MTEPLEQRVKTRLGPEAVEHWTNGQPREICGVSVTRLFEPVQRLERFAEAGVNLRDERA